MTPALKAQLASACGLAGSLVVVLLTIIGGQLFPDYSHSAQFISELGASGAPHASIVNLAGFLPAGVLISLFAFLAWQVLPKSRTTTLGMVGILLYAIGYIAATFFPCDAGCRPAEQSLSQLVHNFLGLAGYVTAPLALFGLGWKARKWPGARGLSVIGMAGSVVALGGLLLLSPDFRYVGLAQRALEGSVLAWVVACSIYLRPASPSPHK